MSGWHRDCDFFFLDRGKFCNNCNRSIKFKEKNWKEKEKEKRVSIVDILICVIFKISFERVYIYTRLEKDPLQISRAVEHRISGNRWLCRATWIVSRICYSFRSSTGGAMLAAHLHLNNYAACFSYIWVDYLINISYVYLYIYTSCQLANNFYRVSQFQKCCSVTACYEINHQFEINKFMFRFVSTG